MVLSMTRTHLAGWLVLSVTALFAQFPVDKKSLGIKGNNPYFPLTPGYGLTYKHGYDTEAVTVLNETRTIDGVECRVVEDREEKAGQLIELTRDCRPGRHVRQLHLRGGDHAARKGREGSEVVRQGRRAGERRGDGARFVRAEVGMRPTVPSQVSCAWTAKHRRGYLLASAVVVAEHGNLPVLSRG